MIRWGRLKSIFGSERVVVPIAELIEGQSAWIEGEAMAYSYPLPTPYSTTRAVTLTVHQFKLQNQGLMSGHKIVEHVGDVDFGQRFLVRDNSGIAVIDRQGWSEIVGVKEYASRDDRLLHAFRTFFADSPELYEFDKYDAVGGARTRSVQISIPIGSRVRIHGLVERVDASEIPNLPSTESLYRERARCFQLCPGEKPMKIEAVHIKNIEGVHIKVDHGLPAITPITELIENQGAWIEGEVLPFGAPLPTPFSQQEAATLTTQQFERRHDRESRDANECVCDVDFGQRFLVRDSTGTAIIDRRGWSTLKGVVRPASPNADNLDRFRTFFAEAPSLYEFEKYDAIGAFSARSQQTIVPVGARVRIWGVVERIANPGIANMKSGSQHWRQRDECFQLYPGDEKMKIEVLKT